MTQRRRLDHYLAEQAAVGRRGLPRRRQGEPLSDRTRARPGRSSAASASRGRRAGRRGWGERTHAQGARPRRDNTSTASPSRGTSPTTPRPRRATETGLRSSSARSPAATAGSSRRATTSTSASAAGRAEGPRLRDHLGELCRAHRIDESRVDRPAWPPPAAPAGGVGRGARASTARGRRGRAGRPALRRRDVRGVRVSRLAAETVADCSQGGRRASTPTTSGSRARLARGRRVVGREDRARPLSKADVRARAGAARVGRRRRACSVARSLTRATSGGSRAYH